MPGRTRSRTLAALFASLFLTFVALPVYAQIKLDLPAQSLGQSLTAVGTLGHLNVLFDPPLVDGLQAPALKAYLSAEDALSRLLAGTKLRAVRVDANTIRVIRQPPTTPLSSNDSIAPEAPGTQVSTSRADTMRLAKSSAAAATDSSVEKQEPDSSRQEGRNPKTQLEEVIVTGSHIPGIQNKTSPLLVIDQSQIEQSGYTSTQDLFRSLPQNFASGDAAEDGIFSSNANRGKNTEIASGINLRGLGVSSTLVLLDGHRLAPSAFGSIVDVSLIPLAAIDRIEVLTDGSSAVYGSDAVGGVVNIILKRDYEGAETSAQYGSVSHGDRTEAVVAQTLGTKWHDGNVVGTIQYQRQTALSASDRDFTSDLTLPNDLLPANRSYAATVNGRQNLTEQLEFYGDVLLSKRDYQRATSLSEGAGFSNYVSLVDGNTSNVSVTPGFRYRLTPEWSIDVGGLYGRLRSNTITAATSPFTGSTQFTDVNEFVERSLDLTVNGHLGATSAGDIALAIGGSYRSEMATGSDVASPGAQTVLPRTARHVTAFYGEFYVPLVGDANRTRMLQALEVSLAIRGDRYSDFGSTTNPRIGLRWMPLRDISIRTSYGTSFRAPTASEELAENPSQQILAPLPFFANPSGPGLVSALVVDGSTALNPERSRNLDLGIQYQPSAHPGLNVALSWYDIRYKDRIIQPSLDTNALLEPDVYGQLTSPITGQAAEAFVAAARASGAQYLDPYGVGLSNVQYLADFRQRNAAVVRQSGLDLNSSVTETLGSHTLTARLNASFTDRIDTEFAPGASFANLVNTFSNPPKWRARFDTAWASDKWSINGALNGTGSYVNSSGIGRPPIASWMTVDLGASVNLGAYFQEKAWNGLAVSLIVLNALDRDPPFVSAPGIILVNYDATNANPLGRFLSLRVRKDW